MLLKAWNKTLSTDKNDRLNSFSICLLLLGFMIQKEYMPNLQTLAEKKLTVNWKGDKQAEV